MTVNALYPTVAPSLDLNFVRSGVLDSRVTFTRASTGTYFNSLGTLTTALTNVPRLDYNPTTLAAQGLLIEEQRVNSIRNNTATGAVAGTPGTNPTNWTVTAANNGITKTIVGVGTENGINYVDIQYTTGGGNTTGAGTFIIAGDQTTQITAASGQTWTASSYVKLQAGSTTNLTSVVTNVAERTAAGTLLASTTLSISPTSAALATQRNVLTRLLSDAATERVSSSIFSASYASGVPIDITLRIGLPQLEQGAFATSVIPTTTVAVTRSADVASVNTLTPWYNATEGTFYAEGVAGNLSNSPVFINTNDGTSNNLITSPRLGAAGLARLEGTVGGAAWTAIVTANTTTAGSVFKSASAFKAGDQAICLNGGTTATGANASLPAVTTLRLGSFVGNLNFINGYLRRISYFPIRLSNANLQAITT